MIIVDPDSEKTNASLGNAGPDGTQTTQLIYARIPEPDVSNLSTRIGVMRMTEQDAPPAYEQVTGANASSSSAQRFSQYDRGGPVASGSSASTFEPLILHSRGRRLHEGFFLVLPPTDIVPHPFIQREITTEDWKKFLNELQETARLSNTASSYDSGGPPSPNLIKEAATKFMTSFKANHRMERPQATPPLPQPSSSIPADPSSLIDFWNANIFNPRGIDVVLAKGPRRLSGDRNLLPPDYGTPANSSSIPPSPSLSSPRPDNGPPFMSPSPESAQSFGSQRGSPVPCIRGPRCVGKGCGRSCRRLRRERSVSSSSSSSDSGDDELNGSANRVPGSAARNLSTATATEPFLNMPMPVPHHTGFAEGSTPSTPSGQIPTPNLNAPLPALPSERTDTNASPENRCPHAQRKLERKQNRQARQERKNERFDQRWARKYAKMEQKLEKKGLYLSPFLPVDLAMHGVGMGVGLGMRGVSLGLGMGVRGLGMGLRGVTMGMLGGKAPMNETMMADEADGYYRLIVTDLSRV